MRTLGWTAAGIALGAINPLGPRLLLFPALVGSRTEAFRSVVEWQAPRYDTLIQLLTMGLILAAVLALVRRPRWRDALPVVVFAGLALTSARNQAPMLLVLAPVLAGAVTGRGPDVHSVRRPVLRPALAAVVVLAVVFTVGSLSQPHTNVTAYPVSSVQWMEDEGLLDPGSRVVSTDDVGNFLEARRGGDARVFIDDRVDMFPLDLIDDYQELLTAGPEWADVLERREATAVVWKSDTPLGGALAASDDWRIVRRDAPWVVAVPVGSR